MFDGGRIRSPARLWDPLSRFLSPRILLADRFLHATPGLLGLEFEPVEFPGSSGVPLRGWLLAGEGPGTLVFCPGNSGNLSSHILYLGLARRAGLPVLGFDYRGFGRSEGRADLRTVTADILSACRFVAARRGPGEPVGLFGVSLGAVAALAAAARSRDGEEGAPRVGAVAVEGLSDVRDMLEGLFRAGSFGPVRVRRTIAPGDDDSRERRRTAILKRRLPPFLAAPLASIMSIAYPFEGKRPRLLAPRLAEVPVLLIHGVEDEVLPFEATLDVFQGLRGPRRLWLVPRAGHAQEPALSHGVEYAAQLREFFRSSFSPSGPGGGPPPAEEGRARTASLLHTRLRDGVLEQRVLAAGDGAPAGATGREGELETGIEAWTLGPDGFPLPGLDPLSERYRRGGYRDAFRRLVLAVNAMDLAGLDASLESYLELRRELPFDLLASTYCLRLAQTGVGGTPGWPRAGRDLVERSLERFRTLREPHAGLPGRDCPESPLLWVEKTQAELGIRERG